VAGFFADEDVAGVGRVFVVLLGSITNVTGWRGGDRLQIDRFPSDAAGMYEILMATLEPGEATVDPNYLEWDQEARDAILSFEAAHRLAYRDDTSLKHPRVFQFLAVSHHYEVDVDINHIHYDAALLGAPVWAASPPPEPIASSR
jgi:hypothetical protein